VDASEVRSVADLTAKQQRFVEEYLVDLNATQAAIRAEYSEKTARQQGQHLLTNIDIQEAIQRGKKELSEKTKITQERVINELAKVAFADAADNPTADLRYTNKLRALEMLAKHLGLFERSNEDDGNEGCGVVQMPSVMPADKPPEVNA
jgi:phage terminase small subunit